MKGLCWVAAALVLALVAPSAALAQKPSVREAVSTYEYTQNMHPLGILAVFQHAEPARADVHGQL